MTTDSWTAAASRDPAHVREQVRQQAEIGEPIREIEVAPLEEPVPEFAPVEEPAESPAQPTREPERVPA